jgi:hypothetical protein
MGCPALGVWVAFLKQPGKVPQTKKIKIKIKIINKKITNESKIVQKYIYLFFGWRSARQCIRLFQKSDLNPQCWTSHLFRLVPCYFLFVYILK